MAVNLTGANNMAMQSQMTGAAQRAKPRRVVRREVQVRHEPTTKQTTSRKAPKDKFTKGAGKKPKTHQKKAKQVMQRFVATTAASTSLKKTAKKKETDQSQQTQHAPQEEGADKAQTNVPLDNASRIGLMYQQKMRRQRAKKGRVQNDRGPQSQQTRLKGFLSNLKKAVKLEYQQYTKTDISTYSKRNLREILTALGDGVKSFDDKAAKDRRDRQNSNGVGKKFYNRHYAATASKRLKLFNEDPMQDPNYSPFEMIA